MGGELCRCLRFLKRKLGISMQVDVERFDGGINGFDLRGGRRGPRRALAGHHAAQSESDQRGSGDSSGRFHASL
jgi:hypothetical protein